MMGIEPQGFKYQIDVKKVLKSVIVDNEKKIYTKPSRKRQY